MTCQPIMTEVQLFALEREHYMSTLGHLEGVVRAAGDGEMAVGEADRWPKGAGCEGSPFRSMEEQPCGYLQAADGDGQGQCDGRSSGLLSVGRKV